MQNHISQTSTDGYTLIELVVVIAISAILLITAVALFFTTFIGGGKTASAEYTKQAGGQTLSRMTFLIRNSKKIVQNSAGEICGSPMQSIKVLNLDGSTVEFSANSNRIRSVETPVSGGATTSFLTPSDVSLAPAVSPNYQLTFSCTPPLYGQSGWDGSPPIVQVNFTLQKGVGGAARDLVSIPFSTSITLRNF